MADPRRMSSYDDTPIYTIKTVVQQTGITPATLRAWERRYGVLEPGRSEGGYRLYSERDIATLLWLKSQVDDGVAISRAVALLERHHEAGETPELAMTVKPIGTGVSAGVRSTVVIIGDLLAALLAFDESTAEMVLSEAFGLFPVDVVAEEIIAPTLAEIGERWHRDEVTIVQEHYATAFLRRRLTSLFNAYDQPASGPLAITGAAPTEWHDVGILLVSLALRRNGWRVLHLGQNVPARHLIDAATRLRPALVCLSAAMFSSAAELLPIADALKRLPEPRPRLMLGGRAFNANPELRDRFPEAYVGASARELISVL